MPDTYLPKLLDDNNQVGNGAYELQASDLGDMIPVDGAVTIPAGLAGGFQCTVQNTTTGALLLNRDASYTTEWGGSDASISANGVVVISVLKSDPTILIINGETE